MSSFFLFREMEHIIIILDEKSSNYHNAMFRKTIVVKTNKRKTIRKLQLPLSFLGHQVFIFYFFVYIKQLTLLGGGRVVPVLYFNRISHDVQQ